MPWHQRQPERYPTVLVHEFMRLFPTKCSKNDIKVTSWIGTPPNKSNQSAFPAIYIVGLWTYCAKKYEKKHPKQTSVFWYVLSALNPESPCFFRNTLGIGKALPSINLGLKAWLLEAGFSTAMFSSRLLEYISVHQIPSNGTCCFSCSHIIYTIYIKYQVFAHLLFDFEYYRRIWLNIYIYSSVCVWVCKYTLRPQYITYLHHTKSTWDVSQNFVALKMVLRTS